jgi:hypothetical protein
MDQDCRHSGHGATVNQRQRLGVVGLSCLLAFLSATVYSRYFSGHVWALALLGAALLPGAVVLFGLRRDWTTTRLVTCGVAVLILYATYTLFPGTTYFGLPTLTTVRDLSAGLAHGWYRLLTAGLPSRVTGPLLAPLETIIWAAAVAGAILAVRGRGLLAPILPPFLAFVAGLALTASRAGTALWATAAFVAVATTQAIWRADAPLGADPDSATPAAGELSHTGRRAGRFGLGLPVVIILTAAAAGSIAAFPLSGSPRRLDPRTLLHRAPVLISGVSPLAEVKAQLDAKPVRQLFSVRLRILGSRPTPIDRLRLLGLATYDGSLWTTTDAFEQGGVTLPGSPSLDRAAATDVDERISVTGLPGPFLLTAGQPIKTNAPGTAFDPAAGDLMTTTANRTAITYEDLSEVTRPTNGELSRVSVYHGRGSATLSALPADTPQQIFTLARTLAASQPSQIGQLRAIERYLRNKYSYNRNAPSGSSLASVDRFLFDTKSGQPEQFAAAFAVLARALHLPSRIAVGYLLNARNGIGGGGYAVTSADAYAWPEVEFDRYGWVAFNPMDARRVVGSAPQPIPAVAPQTKDSPASRPESAAAVSAPGGSTSASTSRAGGGPSGLLIAGLVVAGLMALVLAALLGLVVAAKAARRHRRATLSSAAGRVFGAWLEICDRLIEHGVVVTPNLTPSEVAERAGPHVGAAASSAIAAMAPIVGTATYARGEPDDRMAEQAWVLEAQARTLISRDANRWARWQAHFDPRPLRTRQIRPRRVLSGTIPAGASR